MIRKFGNKKLPRGIQINRGRVWIRIFPNGKRFTKCIGPASQPRIIDDAILKLNQYREQIRLGKFGLEERCRRITAEQAVETFWNLHGSQKKSNYTFKLFLNNFRKHFSGRYVDSITRMDIQRYRAGRLKSVMPSSFNRERTVWVTLFNKLREWKDEGDIGNCRLPDRNPAALVRRDNERIYARKRVLSQEEFERFMSVADPKIRRITLAAIHTTLRLDDLKTLTRENVNESTNQIEGVQGKTEKAYAVPINVVVRQIIAGSTGRKLLDFTNFRKLFEAAREEAGIQNFEFRDLRRTGARMMLKKGVDIATVSAYLGHASIHMTQIYVPPSMNDKQIAGELLGTSYGWNESQNCNINCNKADFEKSPKIKNEAQI